MNTGVARCLAAACLRPQQLGVEDGADALHIFQRLRLVVIDLRALELVAGEQVTERSLVLLEVRVGLAQREFQVDALTLGHRCRIAGQPAP